MLDLADLAGPLRAVDEGDGRFGDAEARLLAQEGHLDQEAVAGAEDAV